MNTLQLAWSNAEAGHNWHGKGKKADYLAVSMKLAHNGVNLKRNLYIKLAVTCLAVLPIGMVIGAKVADLVVIL